MSPPENLGLAIAAYRSGVAEYDAASHADNETADAHARVSYEPPLDLLTDWREPAANFEEALAALELALEEVTSFHCSPMAQAMLTAGVGYLRQPRVRVRHANT